MCPICSGAAEGITAGHANINIEIFLLLINITSAILNDNNLI